jgi:predicted metal-binding membrane protein
MSIPSRTLGSAVLIAAGLYQWTPLKHACLHHCRSPLEFIMTEWRDGTAGALAMGARHGLYCLGCCWLLMLLLFVGGIMNIGWIAGLTVFIFIEKVAPAGHWIGRAGGALLIVLGAVTLISAHW